MLIPSHAAAGGTPAVPSHNSARSLDEPVDAVVGPVEIVMEEHEPADTRGSREADRLGELECPQPTRSGCSSR